MNGDDSSQGWVRVAEATALDRDSEDTQTVKRIHTQVDGRYVSIFRIFRPPTDVQTSQLFAIDSTCYHSGGPLGLGDIEELENGDICIVCPWHYYHCSLKSGDKLYRSTVEAPDGSLQPGTWKSVGKRQRKHQVEHRENGIYLKLNLEGTMESDQYCHNEVAGQRVLHGVLPRSSLQIHSHHCDSPGRTSPHNNSPNPYYGEGEDVWPDDLNLGGRRRSASPYKQRRPGSGAGGASSPLAGPQL